MEVLDATAKLEFAALVGLGANYLTNAAPESPSGRFLESVGSLTLRLGAASADVLSDIAESNNDAAAATDKGDETEDEKKEKGSPTGTETSNGSGGDHSVSSETAAEASEQSATAEKISEGELAKSLPTTAPAIVTAPVLVSPPVAAPTKPVTAVATAAATTAVTAAAAATTATSKATPYSKEYTTAVATTTPYYSLPASSAAPATKERGRKRRGLLTAVKRLVVATGVLLAIGAATKSGVL